MSQKRKLQLGLGGGILALIVGVGLQNMEPVGFQFLFWRVTSVSKLYLLLATFLLGLGLGYLFAKHPWRHD